MRSHITSLWWKTGERGCLAAIGRPRLTPKGSFVPIPASLPFPPAACFLFLSLIISPSQSLHAPISILYFVRFPPWLLRFQFLLVGVDTIDFFKNERQSAATSRSGVGGASHSNRSNRMVKGGMEEGRVRIITVRQHCKQERKNTYSFIVALSVRARFVSSLKGRQDWKYQPVERRTLDIW